MRTSRAAELGVQCLRGYHVDESDTLDKTAIITDLESQIIRPNKALRLRAFPFNQVDIVDILLALPSILALKLRLRHCTLRGGIQEYS